MGSGKGGGGGGGRVGGGGGSAAGAGGGGGANQGLLPGEKVPPYQPPWYTDLPPVENANRKVNADGEVIVGAKGALPSTNRFGTENAARDHLRDNIGMPAHLAATLARDDMAKDVANMLPDGAEYLGHGIEGIGVAISKDKAVRIQYDGREPLNAYDVGRSGVYADWKKKYGNVWVEQKERIEFTASEAIRSVKFKDININEMKGRMEESFTPDARGTVRSGRGVYTKNKPAQWADVDMHSGNWGFDFAGRPRVFDQGAVRPLWDQRYAARSD